MEFASEDAADFVPTSASAENFWEVLERDPIATLRSLIRSVSFCMLTFNSINVIMARF